MKLKKRKIISKKTLIISIAVLVVAVATYTAVAARNSYWPYTAKSTDIPTSENKANGDDTEKPTVDKDGSTAPEKGTPDTPVAQTPDESVVPNAPTGTFVSNHEPNLSGSPAPNTENSTCKTTPGAQCVIIFQNGSTIRTLPTQTTDASGNTLWNWAIQDIGLTAGEWSVTARATNGSKTASTTDPMKLIVKP